MLPEIILSIGASLLLIAPVVGWRLGRAREALELGHVHEGLHRLDVERLHHRPAVSETMNRSHISMRSFHNPVFFPRHNPFDPTHRCPKTCKSTRR